MGITERIDGVTEIRKDVTGTACEHCAVGG